MHAILHSFAYPLKPLTQASISIRSTKPVSLSKLSPTCEILPKKCHVALSPLHAVGPLAMRDIAHSIRVSHTRNSSSPPFHPSVSHPESFSAAIPSGYLTPGIPLRRHSIRVSHPRNPSPSPFHQDASHMEFFSAIIPSGCHTPGILLRQHSTPDVSHPEFFSANILPGCLTSGILPGRCSTFLGYLASGILSADIPPEYLTSGILPGRRSTFSGCLTSGILPADVPPSPDISHPALDAG